MTKVALLVLLLACGSSARDDKSASQEAPKVAPVPRPTGPLAEGNAAYQVGDNAAAKRHWEEACTGGVMEGCARLAERMARDQLLGPSDPVVVDRAEAFAKRACDAKDVRGCSALGMVHEDFPRAQWTDSVARYTLGCDGGYYAACLALGHLYYDNAGRLAPRDLAKAADFFARACKLDAAIDPKDVDWPLGQEGCVFEQEVRAKAR